MKGIFVTGSGTDVGKTFVSTGLVYCARQKGLDIAYFKPVATGWTTKDDNFISADEKQVALVCEDWSIVHHSYVFEPPVSPHLAARKAQKTISLDTILSQLEKLKHQYDWLVVEGAGGVAVPLDDKGTLMVDMIREIGFPVVLVSYAGLGTINHTVLSVNFLRQAGIPIIAILLTKGRKEELEHDNQHTIQRLTGIPVIGVLPFLVDTSHPRSLQDYYTLHQDMFFHVFNILS